MTAFQKQQTEICIKNLKFEKLWKLKTGLRWIQWVKQLRGIATIRLYNFPRWDRTKRKTRTAGAWM